MPYHEVRQGDCISSISKTYGFFWETVWQHGENSELREKRKDPNVLLAGDRVFVPDKEMHHESGATEERHRFRVRGVPAQLRIRIMKEPEPEGSEPSSPESAAGEEKNPTVEDPEIDAEEREDEPRANTPFRLEIDGVITEEGKTDDDGMIEVSLPPDAKKGDLYIDPGSDHETVIPLNLGQLDPLTEPSGVSRRLYNLGFDCGDENDPDSPEFKAAVSAFQEKHALEVTGDVDESTKNKLKEVHGA